jgi:hypothetical protein
MAGHSPTCAELGATELPAKMRENQNNWLCRPVSWWKSAALPACHLFVWFSDNSDKNHNKKEKEKMTAKAGG